MSFWNGQPVSDERRSWTLDPRNGTVVPANCATEVSQVSLVSVEKYSEDHRGSPLYLYILRSEIGGSMSTHTETAQRPNGKQPSRQVKSGTTMLAPFVLQINVPSHVMSWK